MGPSIRAHLEEEEQEEETGQLKVREHSALLLPAVQPGREGARVSPGTAKPSTARLMLPA